ncbi:MAG: carboxypeptidase regulatory-like domain-containing protein [Ignavibacteriae bacterium]|nr:carboxypeptidase regulatory-like domain-containing protein [Ignavibacteriota bacterium]
MKRISRLVLLAFVFFLSASSDAQQLRLTLTMSAKPSPYISDWATHRETVLLTVMNPGSAPVDAKLRAIVRLDGTIKAQTRTAAVPVVSVPPGVSTYYADQILPPEAVSFSGGVERTAMRTGMLPAGTYELCVDLVDASGAQPLSQPACRNFQVTSYQLPTLLAPENRASLNRAARPTFRWTPVVPAPPGGARYRVKIFEVLQGQTAGTLLRSGMPVYEQEIAGLTQMLWPTDFQPSGVTKNYAWSVQVIDDNGRPLGEQDGWAEPFSFAYSEDIAQKGAQVDTDRRVKPGGQKDPGKLKQALSSIKGKLVWAFRKSEMMQSVSEKIDIVPEVNISKEESYIGIVQAQKGHSHGTPPGHAGTYAGIGGTGAAVSLKPNDVAIFGGGSTTTVGMSDAIKGKKNYSTPGEPGPLTLPGEWNPVLEEYAADQRHPLMFVNVKLTITKKILDLPPGVPPPSGNTKTITIGSVTTDKNGEFTFTFLDKGDGTIPAIEIEGVTYEFNGVSFEVSDPHFLYEEQPIPLQQVEGVAQKWMFPTVVALAQTYRLRAKAVDAQTNKAVPQPASVEVYRPLMWYLFNPNTVNEGLIPPTDRPIRTVAGFGQFLIGAATAPQPVTRLFQNEGGPYDRYYLRVSVPGYDTLTTYVSAITGGGYWSSVTTVEKTFKLSRAKPVVRGRIVEKDSKAAVSHAGITLTGKTHDYYAESDADGRFVLSGIEPETDAYELSVTAFGIKKVYKEKIFLDVLGKVVERDPLEIDVAGNPVSGKVVDEDGQPVAGALVHWSSGGDPFSTNELGVFKSSNIAGSHGIKIWKPGYMDLDTVVSVQQIKTQSQKGGGGAKDYLQGPQNNFGPFVLKRRIGRLLVTVRDKLDNTPVSGARVVLADFADLGITGTDGSFYFPKAPGGAITLRVFGATGTMHVTPGSKASVILKALGAQSPPPGAPDYAYYSAAITVSDEGDTTRVDVALARGARVSGTVTASALPVKDALVRVDGIDDLYHKTADNGTYTIVGVPTGAQTLKAGKQGMIGDVKNVDLPVGSTTVDFSLGSAGFDISTILGFPVVIESLTLGADTVASGAFVDIPKNGVFSLPPGSTIPFADMKLTVLGGKAEPKGGKLVTDASELAAAAFDLVPVTLRNNTGIEVVKTPGGGQILARVNVDLNTMLQGAPGVETMTPKALYLVTPALANQATPPAIPVFVSTGALPFPSDGLVFGKGSISFSVYGFTVTPDLAKSSLKPDGLHLAGKLGFTGVPLLASTTLTITDLWVGYSGGLKHALVSLSPKPAVTLGTWKLTLDAATLAPNGFSFGGSLEFTIPSSSKTTIAVSDLTVSPDQIYGGALTLPDAGIDVFSVMKIKGNGTPFALGSVGADGPLSISGGGTFSLPKFDKSLTLESFEVRTDGKFSALAAINSKADFAGLATFTLNSLGFSTIGTPKVEVGGELGLKIPMVAVNAGGQFSYSKGGGFDMKKVKIGFSIPAATIETDIGWGNNFFTGKGKIGISSTPMNLDFMLTYSKTSFSADFMANIPPIQIGYVTLTKVGGGFGYLTDPQDNKKKYRITVRGALSIAGTGALLAIDPLEVTVRSGPVIEGGAIVTLVGQPVADAKLIMDFPNKFFSVEGNVGGSIIPDLNMKAQAKSIIAISAKDGDSYLAVGFAAQVSMLKIVNSTTNVFVGFDLNRAKHPEYDVYTSFIPVEYLSNGNTVNGAHLNVVSVIDASASGNFLDIASGSIWYKNEAWTQFHVNFALNKYGLAIGNSWGGGGDLSIAGKSVAGLSVTASAGIAGAYSPSSGWFFCGKAGGSIVAWIGDCSSACANKICWCGCFNPCWPWSSCKVCPIPCGGKLCLSATVMAKYSSKTGLDFCVDWPGHGCSICP